MSDDWRTIETNRLRGNAVSFQSLDLYTELHTDPRVMKTLSAEGLPLTTEEIRTRLQKAMDCWEKDGFGFWLFTHRETGECIGCGGLKQYQFEDGPQLGLAYSVKSDHWRQGYATEMATATLNFGFQELQAEWIGSWTLPINIASQRTMQKLGFVYEKEFMFADLLHRYYRLTRKNWELSEGAVFRQHDWPK